MANLRPGRMRVSDTVKGDNCNTPNEPGVYRHVDRETNKVEYVGQTNDLRKRQQEHARDGRLDLEQQRVEYSLGCNLEKDDLCRIEQEHIGRHRPSGNSTKGGNGRR